MSDFEKRLKSLKLQGPSDSLDERILSVLRGDSSETARRDQSEAVTELSTGVSAGRPQPSGSRRGAVVSGWIVASVAMLIGAVVGNSLPTFLPYHGRGLSGSQMSGRESSAKQILASGGPSERRSVEQGGSAESGSLRNVDMNLADYRSLSSQIVESNWISPIAAAVAWEQQTGQIFNVRSHVSDRRFDMCRDCHRVGG